MPHCIIEYAKHLEEQLPASQLIEATHRGARNSGLFEEHDIKTRTLAFEHYQTGTGQQPFIHVTAKILSGRTSQQKAALSQQILSALRQLPLPSVSLTVDVCDIDRAAYAKHVS